MGRERERNRTRKRHRERQRHKEKETERDRYRETQSLNNLSIHHWVHSGTHASRQQTSPIGFLSLKLPPPPCAVLLVFIIIWRLPGCGPKKTLIARYFKTTSDFQNHRASSVWQSPECWWSFLQCAIVSVSEQKDKNLCGSPEVECCCPLLPPIPAVLAASNRHYTQLYKMNCGYGRTPSMINRTN